MLDECLASARSTRLNSAMAISMAFGSNSIIALYTSSGSPTLPAAAATETRRQQMLRLRKLATDAAVEPGA